MFTFGREHEKVCAANYLRDQRELSKIHEVIDVAHDLLEGNLPESEIRPILVKAFSEGGSGVWEQTAKWIRNLIRDYPSLATIWDELAEHPDWKVRWRTACVLDWMPIEVARRIGPLLASDKSKKVRQYAEDRLLYLTLEHGKSH